MAFTKIYTRINWENYPSVNTALSANNLNKMDYSINKLDDEVVELDVKKAEQATILSMVKDWSMDVTTGIITVTKLDGTQIMFDLNIEKIPVEFELSEDGILTMTTEDGTKYTANIGDMIPVLVFQDSDTISVSVTGEGIDKTYSFSIKDGSVTEDKLQPNYLAEIKVQTETVTKKAEETKNNTKTTADYTNQAKTYRDEAFQFRNEAESFTQKGFITLTEQVSSLKEQTANQQVQIDGIEAKIDCIDGPTWDICYVAENGFCDIVCADGIYVAVGNGILHSDDGSNWDYANGIDAESNVLNSVTYGNGRFVCVGNNGKSYYSTDGMHWNVMSGLDENTEFTDVVYGNDRFVCVGGYDIAYYSIDGEAWTGMSGMTLSIPLQAVTYGNGKFVCVGDLGFGYQSIDGENWGIFRYGGEFVQHSIVYGNDRFVTVGGKGTSFYSTDGLTWNEMTGLDSEYSYIAVAFGDGRFVAVSEDGGKSYYSTDGMTWNEMYGLSSDMINAVAYVENMFICVDSERRIYYLKCSIKEAIKTDKTLTKEDAPADAKAVGDKLAEVNNEITGLKTIDIPKNDFYVSAEYEGIELDDSTYERAGVAFGNGLYVVVDSGIWYSELTADSPEIHACETSDFDVTAMNDCTYGNDKFIAVGNGGVIAYSEDGKQWSVVDTVTTEDLFATTYGNGKFVAVGSEGTILYSEDGIVWNTCTIVKREVTEGNSSGVVMHGSIKYKNVIYTGNKFVATGITTITSGNVSNSYVAVNSSVDGINWDYEWYDKDLYVSGSVHNSLAFDPAYGTFYATYGATLYCSKNGLDWYYYGVTMEPVFIANDIAVMGDRLFFASYAGTLCCASIGKYYPDPAVKQPDSTTTNSVESVIVGSYNYIKAVSTCGNRSDLIAVDINKIVLIDYATEKETIDEAIISRLINEKKEPFVFGYCGENYGFYTDKERKKENFYPFLQNVPQIVAHGEIQITSTSDSGIFIPLEVNAMYVLYAMTAAVSTGAFRGYRNRNIYTSIRTDTSLPVYVQFDNGSGGTSALSAVYTTTSVEEFGVTIKPSAVAYKLRYALVRIM